MRKIISYHQYNSEKIAVHVPQVLIKILLLK